MCHLSRDASDVEGTAFLGALVELLVVLAVSPHVYIGDIDLGALYPVLHDAGMLCRIHAAYPRTEAGTAQPVSGTYALDKKEPLRFLAFQENVAPCGTRDRADPLKFNTRHHPFEGAVAVFCLFGWIVEVKARGEDYTVKLYVHDLIGHVVVDGLYLAPPLALSALDTSFDPACKASGCLSHCLLGLVSEGHLAKVRYSFGYGLFGHMNAWGLGIFPRERSHFRFR